MISKASGSAAAARLETARPVEKGPRAGDSRPGQSGARAHTRWDGHNHVRGACKREPGPNSKLRCRQHKLSAAPSGATVWVGRFLQSKRKPTVARGRRLRAGRLPRLRESGGEAGRNSRQGVRGPGSDRNGHRQPCRCRWYVRNLSFLWRYFVINLLDKTTPRSLPAARVGRDEPRYYLAATGLTPSLAAPR